MSTHFHSLRVKQVRPDTDEAVIVSFDVPEPLAPEFRFMAGQHLTLRSMRGDVEQRRSYSICSGVGDGELCIGVRKLPGGVVSTWINEMLKAGENVEVMPPGGSFCVAPQPAVARRYLGIAAGSGITPVLAIVKTVLAHEPQSCFTLVYGNRQQRSTMFLEELQDLKDRYLARLSLHWVFSREQLDSPLHSGRLGRDKLAEFFAGPIDVRRIDHAFICGPHGVDDEATAALLAAGMAAEHIHIERFGVPKAAGERPPLGFHTPPAAKAHAHARVLIVRDGVSREIEFTDRHDNLLQAAADAGLDVPYSCRSGVCSTCRAKLLQGEVQMARNFALDAGEVAAGFVLTCQARPLTERVVLSFDER